MTFPSFPRFATIAVVLLLTFLSLRPAIAADDALIAKARSTLYTNREASILLLEDAVKQHPEEVAYWVEYINAINVDSLDTFAERASLHALSLHPNQPDLLIARARLHIDGEGLEVLKQLAQVPGFGEKARRYSNLITCSLRIPEMEPWPVETYAALVDRLADLGRNADAVQYLNDGIKSYAGEVGYPLVERLAMLTALDGKFDEAMKLHHAAGDVQIEMAGTYFGIADVLLTKDKPEIAVASFAGHAPETDPFRRVLAIAKSRFKDAEGALKLLNGEKGEDRLLRCRVLLDAGRKDDAKQLGSEIVAPMKQYQGSYGGPWIRTVYFGPRCLIEDQLFVTRWLIEQFPEKRAAIEFELGKGTEKRSDTRGRGWTPNAPDSQTIAPLERELKTVDPKERQFLCIQLCYAYERAGRYADAAAVLTSTPPTDWQGRVGYDWAWWSILRRKVQAAGEKNYLATVASRPLINAVRQQVFQSNAQDRKLGQPDDASVKGLVGLGPAVLSDVLIQLGPNTYSGTDRRAWVEVVDQLGSAQDAPVLISALGRMGTTSEYPRNNENNANTSAAIDACLQKLTGANPDGKDRVAAWSKWWGENYLRISKL